MLCLIEYVIIGMITVITLLLTLCIAAEICILLFRCTHVRLGSLLVFQLLAVSQLVLFVLIIEKAQVKITNKSVVSLVLFFIIAQEQVFAHLVFNIVWIVAELGRDKLDNLAIYFGVLLRFSGCMTVRSRSLLPYLVQRPLVFLLLMRLFTDRLCVVSYDVEWIDGHASFYWVRCLARFVFWSSHAVKSLRLCSLLQL